MKPMSLQRFLSSPALAAALLVLASPALPAEAPPTVDDAVAFVERAEKELLEIWIKSERAEWVQRNFITEDTDLIAADALAEKIAATMRFAEDSVRFDGLDLPDDVRRKIMLLRTSLALAAPGDPAKQEELSRITTGLSSLYGRGKFCPAGKEGECLDLEELMRIMAESRDPRELLDTWKGWRTISPPMRDMYRRFVELANEGARELGYPDNGARWRSGYDMDPDAFAAEMDRLWGQVRPLYEALHCYVRAKLADRYGADVVPLDKPIPAHLLGNMWAQSWINIYDIVGPEGTEPGFDLTRILQEKKLDAVSMVRYGERFFTSLGFDPLPESFWKRSLFVKPRDREVVCHASAWDVDWENDLRLKMCIDVNAEDFSTIHHELGHNFYQRAYNRLDPLFRDSANDGFHEGVGDTIALSVTPEYLAKVGLLDEAPKDAGDLEYLLRMALEKVAFLPFGMIVDQWRWKVFSGEVQPDAYNQAWWALREKYQGIAAPVPRTEADFDPGAKYHIPVNTPYSRYFLAAILQFQFHRALCDAAGYEGPLHRCSIYGNKTAGARLIRMLEMGRSRPWPEAMEAISGQREMDASAIRDYFAPLKAWLDEQNEGRGCGW